MILRLDSPMSLPTLLLLAVIASGCESTPECNDCPPVGGTWAMEFSNVGALPEACTAVGVFSMEGPLELTQVGAALTGTLDGVALRGSVLETWEFTVNGSTSSDGGTSRSLALNGRYGPETTPDAGDRLVGNLTQSLGAGEDTCIFTLGYTATRAP